MVHKSPRPSLSTFSDFAAEYENFDVPAILAESATARDVIPFNQAAAMFIRILDLLGDAELTTEHRMAGIRLSKKLQEVLEASTASDPTARERFKLARRATFDRLLGSAKFPEYVKLAILEG